MAERVCLQARLNNDYWVQRSWSHGPVLVRPLTRIDAPAPKGRVVAGPMDIVGATWAPPGGVSAVQVAVDGGGWAEAELAAQFAPAVWRRWRFRVMLSPGRHQLRARCVAHDGTVQDVTPRPRFPTGASGHRTISVTAS